MIDAQIASATPIVPPSMEEAVALFGDITSQWKESTPEERSKLISPLMNASTWTWT